jgi:hypothetical protein
VSETTEYPSFSNLPIPDFRYFPTHLLETSGPKQWARIRFLQACERTKIPPKLWPIFSDLGFPREHHHAYGIVGEAFQITQFNVLHESEAEWRERTRQLFEKFLDKKAALFSKMLQNELAKGTLTRIRPVRGTTPLDLRYEWAARRYCYNTPYKKLATKGYTDDRIKQSVGVILKEIGLRPSKVK